MDKPSLRKTLRKNRCLIPADGFYGWKKLGKKTSVPFRFVLPDVGIFSIAGTWEEFEDTNGNELHTFSIITTVANAMVNIVQERMPAILTPATEKAWLNGESELDELIGLLVPFSGQIHHYPVSPRISDSSTNLPSLILPTPPADQFGNLTLFD